MVPSWEGLSWGLGPLLAGNHPWCSGRDPYSQAQRLQVGKSEWRVAADPQHLT